MAGSSRSAFVASSSRRAKARVDGKNANRRNQEGLDRMSRQNLTVRDLWMETALLVVRHTLVHDPLYPQGQHQTQRAHQ